MSETEKVTEADLNWLVQQVRPNERAEAAVLVDRISATIRAQGEALEDAAVGIDDVVAELESIGIVSMNSELRLIAKNCRARSAREAAPATAQGE